MNKITRKKPCYYRINNPKYIDFTSMYPNIIFENSFTFNLLKQCLTKCIFTKRGDK